MINIRRFFFNSFIVKHYQYVSFDIFDTLIERDVFKPSEIFKLVGSKVLGSENAEEFCEKRIVAEKEARLQLEKEVNIYDIYDFLPLEYEKYLEDLIKTELSCELEHCYPIDEMKNFALELLGSGKVIFLISDMYLPDTVINAMLEKCGVCFTKNVYVSNKCNACKLDGTLFKYVLDENNINSNAMIHLGDSIKADYFGARKAGVHAIITRRKNRFRRMLVQYAESIRS